MHPLLLLFLFYVSIHHGAKLPKSSSKLFGGENYKPKSANQYHFMQLLHKKEDSIVAVIGPAGSGKTFLACIDAIRRLKEGEIQKIVITRPAVSVDEDLGFLPGSLDKKMLPWTRPMFDAFSRVYSKAELINLLSIDKIEICPLCFMRGRTFDNAFIIADEMQNSTPNQMLMLLTRIGRNSKMVVNGDLEQSDRIQHNGLKDLVVKLKKKRQGFNTSIHLIEMDHNDIQRSSLVNDVLTMYSSNLQNQVQPTANFANTSENTSEYTSEYTSENTSISKKPIETNNHTLNIYIPLSNSQNNDSALIPLSDVNRLKYFI